MHIFICPVSGGAFPVQIGLISELAHYGIKPDIVMGSSGGNVAAYIGLASKWQSKEMEQMAGKLTSSMFATSWWPSYLSFLPSWWIGYFKGSIYAEGSGAISLFREIFEAATISATEIWTGTMNRESGKGQLFSNQKKEDAKIQESEPGFWTRECMPLSYIGDNIDLLALITMASASIPILVPAKIIDGQRFVDGGTSFASPLSALHEQIREISLKEPVHIDYLSSFDMQTIASTTASSLYDNGTITIGELVKSLCIEDRLTALEIIRFQQINTGLDLCFYSADYHIDNAETRGLLEKIEQIREGSPCTILELCPITNNCIDLLNFQPKDVLYLIDQTRVTYKVRFWWLGKPSETLGNISVTKADFRGSNSAPVLRSV
jgi:hypothetical protein